MSPQTDPTMKTTAETLERSKVDALVGSPASVHDVIKAQIEDTSPQLPEHIKTAVINAVINENPTEIKKVTEKAYAEETPTAQEDYNSLTIAGLIGGTNEEVSQNEGAIEEASAKGGKKRKKVFLNTLGATASLGLHDNEIKQALASGNPREELQKVAQDLLTPITRKDAAAFKKIMASNPDLKGRLGVNAEGEVEIPGVALKIVRQTPREREQTFQQLRSSMYRQKSDNNPLTDIKPFEATLERTAQMANGATVALGQTKELVVNPNIVGDEAVAGAVVALVKDIEVSLPVKDAIVIYPVENGSQMAISEKLAAIDSLKKSGKLSGDQFVRIMMSLQAPNYVVSLINHEYTSLEPQAKLDLIRVADRLPLDIRMQQVKEVYKKGDHPPVLSKELLPSKGISPDVSPDIVKQADAIAQGFVTAAALEAYTFNNDNPQVIADVVNGALEFINLPPQDRARWQGQVEAKSVDSAVTSMGMRIIEVALTRDNGKNDMSGVFADIITHFPQVQMGPKNVTPSVREGAIDFARIYLDNLMKVNPYKAARLREAFARGVGTSARATMAERSISIMQPDVRSEKVGQTLQSTFNELAQDLATYSDALPKSEAQTTSETDTKQTEVQDTGKTLDTKQREALSQAANIVLTIRSSLVVIDSATSVEGTIFKRYPKRNILNDAIDRMSRVYEQTKGQLADVDRKDETKMMSAIVEVIVPQAVIDDIPNLSNSSIQEVRSLVQGIKAAYEKDTVPGKAPKMPKALEERLIQAENVLAAREKTIAESTVTNLNTQIQETVKADLTNEKTRVAGNQLNSKWGINIQQ